MADGRTHQRVATATLIVGSLAAGGVYSVWGSKLGAQEPVLWGWVGGLFLGWLITPDLDVDGETIEETRLKRIPLVGPLLYLVFRGMFAPYAVFMPHRSLWSHGIGIGTALRMMYVSLLVYAIGHVWIWTALPPWVLLGAFLGWSAQDIGHWVMDMF